MKTFLNLEDYIVPNKPVVTALGNFDGVHLGHQYLIKKAKEIALGLQGETLIFTFFPHPQLLFNNNVKMLSTLELKLEIIESLGVDNVLIIPFTKKIAELPPNRFVNEILGDLLKVSHVVAGFNYSFGFKGQGNAQDLINLTQQKDIQTTIVDPFYINGELVSSTKIRDYLKLGKIKNAKTLLGYSPTLIGKVVQGNKIGRQIGFPTANIEWDRQIMIPANGVYAVGVSVHNNKHMGVLNIGTKPTVSNKTKITMEVNILDFNEDIYSQDIQIEFYHKLRNEIKFTSIDNLKEQISIDIQKALEYFTKMPL